MVLKDIENLLFSNVILSESGKDIFRGNVTEIPKNLLSKKVRGVRAMYGVLKVYLKGDVDETD